MSNQYPYQLIQEKYHLDFVSDILLNKEDSITFFFDIYEKPMVLRFTSGNIEKIGLPVQREILMTDIFEAIELNNKLAEIEGRHNFIEKLRDKIRHISKEMYLFVPMKSDHPLWLNVRLIPIKTEVHEQKLVFGRVQRIFHEIPDEIIYYQKTYQDSLTRLFTRETLKLHLTYLTNFENSYGIYLDLDQFKKVNDNFGHHAGDQLLIDIANHFISMWEENVLYYRLGGDEFFIYVFSHTIEEVTLRAKKLIKDIENLNEMTKKSGISASIGIVPIRPDTKEYYRLLDLGDQTMYKSKYKGKGHITILEI